eukprot:g784.t1
MFSIKQVLSRLRGKEVDEDESEDESEDSLLLTDSESSDSEGDESDEDKRAEENRDFARGDDVEVLGRQGWVCGRIVRYTYPNNFSVYVSPTVTYYHVPRSRIRSVQTKTIMRAAKYNVGEIIEVFQGGFWQRAAIKKQTFAQGRVVYGVKLAGGKSGKGVFEDHMRKVFRKRQRVEAKVEGWAEYYPGRVVRVHRSSVDGPKGEGRRSMMTYTVKFDDGDYAEELERERLRLPGEKVDLIGRKVSKKYKEKVRRYVNHLKARNFRAAVRMVEKEDIHPDHEDPLSGLNALTRACLAGSKKYVTMLVELGADVDYETKTGLTPMICCAMKGNFKCAEAVLLDPWSRPLANPFRKNRFGEDARGVAEEHKQWRFIKLLDEVTSREGYREALQSYEPLSTKGEVKAAVIKNAGLAIRRAKMLPALNRERRERAVIAIQRRVRQKLAQRRVAQMREEALQRRIEEERMRRIRQAKERFKGIIILKLQKAYRGRRARRRARLLARQRDAARVLQRAMRRWRIHNIVRRKVANEHAEFMTYVATLMQRAVRRFVANRNFVLKKWAAITLQAAYRGMVDRRRAAAIRASLELQQRLNEEHWATIVRLREETRDMVQQYYVLKAKDEMLAGRIVTKWARPHALRLQRLRAACTLQRAWRCHAARRIRAGLHKWLSRPVLRHCLAVRKLKPAV